MNGQRERWLRGSRQLLQDIRDLKSWTWLFTALFSILAGVAWAAWGLAYGMPTPLIVLMCLAAAGLVFVLWYFVILVLHHYFKWPSRHPFMPAQNRTIPTTALSVASGSGWKSTTKKEPNAPSPLRPMSDGEFSVKEKRHGNGLSLHIRNMNPESKTGYSVRIVDLKIWSADAPGGGMFVIYPQYVALGRPTITLPESGGRPKHFDHVEPKHFWIIRNPGSGPWHLQRAERQALELRDGVWQVDLELEWSGMVLPIRKVVSLTSKDKGRTKDSDFVTPAE